MKLSFLMMLALVPCGCASTSAESAFRDTEKLVQTRTEKRIHWNQGTEEDAAAARYVHAQLVRGLMVDTAVQLALFNNQKLQATYEELQVAQADLVQAGLLKNPELAGDLEFPLTGDIDRGGDVSVTEDFVSLFSLAARKRIAGAALEAAKRRVADSVLQMANDVRIAYFSLQSAMQVAEMRRAILDAGDAALDLAKRQNEAGNLSDLDVANEAALYEQVRTDLVRSDAEVAAAREALTRLLGVWGPDANYRIEEKLRELPATEPSLDHLESVAVARRLDLQAAHEEAQTIAHTLAMTKNFRWLPEASLGADYHRGPERFSTVGPTGSLELPIFDQKQAVVARLEGELRAALAREAALAVDVRSEVREARVKLQTRRALVERYERIVVPLRQHVVELSQQQYDAMLLGAYQLLQAKQAEVNAYRELIEALRDYWIARTELERAIGGTLPTVKRTP